tara:strand:- start:1072 stop:1641 length:570 start_codon:yes stop_codon:yes gene_type:complete
MNFIIGLGNPGNQYKLTKHNFGFWVVDKLIEERSLTVKVGKGDYLYAKDNKNIFVKPTSFMNNSGIAIAQLLNYYNESSIEDIIIIYDDIDIALGNIRFKKEGSAGGHNGIKSIIYHLHSDVFNRLKVGIATKQNMRPSEKYVLKPFAKECEKLVKEVINNTVTGINYYLENGITKSMNNFNKKDQHNE